MTLPIYPSGVRGLTWPVMKKSTFNTTIETAPNEYETRIANTNNPIWEWTLTYEYLNNDPGNIQSAFSPYTDYQILQGFYLQQLGSYGQFLFSDPTDNTVGPGLISGSPNPAAALQLLNDGNSPPNWYSPFQRNFGGFFNEDITDLNGTPTIYATTAGGSQTFPSSGYVIGGPGLALPTAAFMGVYVQYKAWPQSTHLTTGYMLIDSAGHLQKITTTGTTGSTIPTFNDSGSTTNDGSAVWTDQGLITTINASFSFYFRVRFEDDDFDPEQFDGVRWTMGGQKSKNGKGYLRLITARPNPL